MGYLGDQGVILRIRWSQKPVGTTPMQARKMCQGCETFQALFVHAVSAWKQGVSGIQVLGW